MTKKDFEARLASISSELEYLATEVELDDSNDIANAISFKNSNEIAYLLMNTSELNEAGVALFRELKYYIEKGNHNE